MLRVLHVIGGMDRGGAETAIMNLYRNIDRNSIQFDFLVHEHRECDFDNEILELGGAIYRLPRYRIVNDCAYRKLCRDFFSSHKEHKIVHGHIGSCASIYLGEASKTGKYTIAHSHSQFFLKGPMGLAFRVMTHSTRNIADYFMACSYEAGVDRFGKKVVEGSKFTVLKNGIDPTLYRCDDLLHAAARNKLGIKDRPVFGHVGRFTNEKNHRFLVEVFSQILLQLDNALLLLAGGGPLEHSIQSLCKSLGIIDSVRFLGVRNDIPDLLKAMDVFIFPSTKEGLAVAAIEAQTAGLPCLLSNGVPPISVIAPQTTRLPLGNAQEWSNKAVEMYTHATNNARSDAIECAKEHGFDVAATANWLSEFYQSVARGR